ncbi:MAG: Type fimbrial biosis protein PilY1 [Proteobacteria bacterium]|nr:Type fimbrial biosis protein PilY1 [Pseudomonadota bacterium]
MPTPRAKSRKSWKSRNPMKALNALVGSLILAATAQAALTPLADLPLSNASAVQIAPNLLFVLDDSDSMDSDYQPDWAGQTTQLSRRRNASFNGLAYNPTISYLPPKYFNADGSANTTTYPSQTGMSIAEGADASTKPNWKQVRNDGYGVQDNGSSNLVGKAYFFTTVAGEYCTKSSLKTCITASAPTDEYPVAAKLRWCKSAADAAAAAPTVGACQATQIDPVYVSGALTNVPFNFPRMPSPRVSKISISGSDGTRIASIKVNGQEILSSATDTTPLPATLASAVEARINACTYGLSGSCQVAGYSAQASGSELVISAPGTTGAQPAITQSGSMTVFATPFARPSNNLAPGENLLTRIAADIAPTTSRNDCAASTCTYDEEMTNYANWWAYYRTRLQAMKTATSLSFDPIGKAYRVGYLSINNNTGSDFQNIARFELGQKKDWYDKLFAAKPGKNTPLRVALSNAGRLYGGRLNGSTLNGVTVADPLQYSCQPNVTLLSTDGYWNEGAGFKLDSTAVGDQDGANVIEEEPDKKVQRPQLDGGAPKQQIQKTQITQTLTNPDVDATQTMREYIYMYTAILSKRTKTELKSSTSAVQFRDAIKESSTSQLMTRAFTQFQTSSGTMQSQTSTLERRSGPVQTRTLGLETRTKTKIMQETSQLQKAVGQAQRVTSRLQQRLTQVQQMTSSDYGSTWTKPSNVTSCTAVTKGANRVLCETSSPSDWNNVAQCTTIAGGESVSNSGLDNETWTYTTGSECRYATSAPENVPTGTCVEIAPSATSPYTVGVAVHCQADFSAAPVNADTCTATSEVHCMYTDWSSPAVENAGCTDLLHSAGPNYTVGTARRCTPTWTDWGDSGAACTPVDGVKECRYKADTPANWSAWTDVASSCTPRAPSLGYLEQIDCRTNFSGWAAAGGTCHSESTGPIQTECRYTDWSTLADDASCPGTGKAKSAGPDYTDAKQCIPATWTNIPGTCVVDGITCQQLWTEWAPAIATCNAVPGVTECAYDGWATYIPDLTCSEVAQSDGPTYSVLTAKRCQQTTFPTTWSASPGACDKTISTRQCQYADWTPLVADPACSAIEKSTGDLLAAGGAKKCSIEWTDWIPTDTCSAATGMVECKNNWSTVTAPNSCPSPAIVPFTNPPSTTGVLCLGFTIEPWHTVPTCTESHEGFIVRRCQPIKVAKPQDITFVATCVEQDATPANGFVKTTCATTTTVSADVITCNASGPTYDNKYVDTTCPVGSYGPTNDTLADVAEYYWKTDLRAAGGAWCTGGERDDGSSGDVCANGNADTFDERQFMRTFTLGLGASGLMQYDKNYEAAAPGSDFFSVKNGELADTSQGICSWQQVGECNWPKPETNRQSNIDDLWHAAVNGRGIYFSAADPSAMVAGITKTVQEIKPKDGSLAAVTVVNPNLLSGENDLFQVTLTTGSWSGDLIKRTINGTTAAISDPVWSAQAKLDAKDWATRKIYISNPAGDGESAPGAADKLRLFQWDKLSSPEQDYFTTPNIASLSQFCTTGDTCLSTANKALASGQNLLNFVRGDKSHEGAPNVLTTYYRERAHLLGDIAGSEAVYVQRSTRSYADYGYADFKTSNASRAAAVYVAANDGMLHAFAATSGEESWAFIPKMVMPGLYRLADKNYNKPAEHRFLVDGTPVSGDICASNCEAVGDVPPPAVWKTILVGGLNRGGRGYYALDITKPAAPKLLWEFTDPNLGYSYGNPVISKLKDGTWVVMVASGYNNVTPGDGQGRLFILNANTGELIRSIPTSAGDTTTPSGLSRITAWADYPDSNNTAQRVYGGDLLGNLWRFDVNGDIPGATGAPDYDAQRLATLKDAAGVPQPQPITARPEIGEVKNVSVVFVATGQLLDGGDLGSTQQQSVYAIKDSLDGTDYGNPRSDSHFVEQTLTKSTCATTTAYCTAGQAIVTGSKNAVDFANDHGWYLDFPSDGERANTDLRLTLGTLSLNTNIPQFGTCEPLAAGVAYAFDYQTGGYVEGTGGQVGVTVSAYRVSAGTIVRMANGELRVLIQTDNPEGLRGGIEPPKLPTEPLPSVRRVSWRELVTE